MSEQTKLHFGGMLCDDHAHMTAEEFHENRTRQYYHERWQALRKIAGNPILTEEVKKEIRIAMHYMDRWEMQSMIIADQREEIDTLKKALYGNILEKQEAKKKLEEKTK